MGRVPACLSQKSSSAAMLVADSYACRNAAGNIAIPEIGIPLLKAPKNSTGASAPHEDSARYFWNIMFQVFIETILFKKHILKFITIKLHNETQSLSKLNHVSICFCIHKIFTHYFFLRSYYIVWVSG